ncbi:hypothetical protein [Kitasatospora sp. NPDC088134]|uniref:hypothetical protein n=1 Tax=Kitasatospora sp. NPDC088134 TaxID=3364071 RepID=UPI00380351C5
MIVRETVGLVLAEERGGDELPPVVVVGERPLRTAAAVPGSVVPVRRDGLDVGVLAPDYRRLVDVLAGGSGSGGEALGCRQLAVALGLDAVPAKVEGVRSKAKRLVARGRPAEECPGVSSLAAERAGSS